MPQTNAEIIAAEPGVWLEVDGKLIPDYAATLKEFGEGDVVTGTVVRVDRDEILVDIGYKSEGVIPISELSIRRNVDPLEEVALGDEVDALVMQKEDADGRLILSKKRARFEKAWRKIEEAAESGEPVEGLVIEVVKGGLILDLGVRGFLPASLVDIRRVQDLEEYRDQTLRARVIELNRSRNNVVLSRRAVLEEERRELRQRILDTLEPGSVVEGVISNIVDFGAFVDLDGIDGLIHISELSWSHVNHPSELLDIGQKVRVKVLDIDRDRQRISLGLKQTQADPWQQVLDAYQQGDVVRGRVTKVVTFGAFVEIVPGVEGLVHISELAAHHVENPREVVSQGDDTPVKIIEVDADRRRLSLSIKRVEPEDEILASIELEGLPPRREPVASTTTTIRGTRPRPTTSRRSSPRSRPRRSRTVSPSPSRKAPRSPTTRPPRRPRRSRPRRSPSRSPRSSPRRRTRASRPRPSPSRRPTVEDEAPPLPSRRPSRSGGAVEAEAEEEAEAEAQADLEPVVEEAEPEAAARGRARSPSPSSVCRTTCSATPPTARSSERPTLRLIFLGLTGGIAAGKSTALARVRARRAVPCSSADAVVHDLYRAPGRPRCGGRAPRQRESSVPTARSTVQRWASVAFGDPEVLGFLERLLHPLVAEETERFRREAEASGAARRGAREPAAVRARAAPIATIARC